MKFRQALRWGYPWLIVQWCCLHYIWAYGLLRDPDVIKQLALLVGLDALFSFGLPVPLVAIFMITAATLALGGLVLEPILHRNTAKLLMMPQYGLVFAALLSDVYALLVGVEGMNGQPINSVVLQVLLLPLSTSAILHTLSIIERYIVAREPIYTSPDRIVEIDGEIFEAYRVRG